MTATAPAPPATATFCAAFQAAAAAHPDRVALRTPGDDARVTWGEYARLVRETAGRLAALGVHRGDAVALLLSNRPEAAWIDAAAMHLGALGISLHVAGTPAAQAYVLGDAEARVLVTERALAGRVLALRRASSALEHVLCVDGAAPGATALDAVEPDPGLDFDAAWRAIGPEDVVTLMYTSGTTGTPKGAAYTHGALARGITGLDAGGRVPDELSTIAFLPFAHAGQRAVVHYRSLLRGATVTCCADPAALPAVLADARPTSLFAPPAVWERLAGAARAAVAGGALDRALERVRGRSAAPLAPADQEALAAVRARLGLDRLVEPFVSGAPSPDELLELLHALGLPVMNVYALTELPPITVSHPDAADIGTAGRPVPDVEVRLGEGDEVQVRHPAASSGYHRRPAQTAALFDTDGWAHTGDIGSLDGAGRLRLHGRLDEQIVTSLGTNVDPVAIELALEGASPLIDRACVVSDGRPHLVALLSVTGPGGENDLRAAVDRVNAGLPEVARIRRFHAVRDRWIPGSDEVTPTMKLRRKAVQARYAEQITTLYET